MSFKFRWNQSKDKAFENKQTLNFKMESQRFYLNIKNYQL